MTSRVVARDVRDQDALFVEQTVEQGALAHIRLAYDGYGYSLL